MLTIRMHRDQADTWRPWQGQSVYSEQITFVFLVRFYPSIYRSLALEVLIDHR
jgi:hypothetical protein